MANCKHVCVERAVSESHPNGSLLRGRFHDDHARGVALQQLPDELESGTSDRAGITAGLKPAIENDVSPSVDVADLAVADGAGDVGPVLHATVRPQHLMLAGERGAVDGLDQRSVR